MSTSDLATRLAALESRFAITDLTARYNDAWDDGRVDDWVSTFTPDGEFVMKGVPQTRGPEALRAMIEAMVPVGFVHLTVDHRVEVHGEAATQRARVILARRAPDRRPGSSVWVASGSYDDELRSTPEGWRFVRRTFAPDASLAGLPAWW
jgi:uncharacterized protein (TIGR02246 family)